MAPLAGPATPGPGGAAPQLLSTRIREHRAEAYDQWTKGRPCCLGCLLAFLACCLLSSKMAVAEVAVVAWLPTGVLLAWLSCVGSCVGGTAVPVALAAETFCIAAVASVGLAVFWESFYVAELGKWHSASVGCPDVLEILKAAQKSAEHGDAEVPVQAVALSPGCAAMVFLSTTLSVAVVEECAKLVALSRIKTALADVPLTWRTWWRYVPLSLPTVIMQVGMLAGAGFGTLENLSYVLGAHAPHAQSAKVGVGLARDLISVPMHILCTGVAASALCARRCAWARLALPILVHGSFDSALLVATVDPALGPAAVCTALGLLTALAVVFVSCWCAARQQEDGQYTIVSSDEDDRC